MTMAMDSTDKLSQSGIVRRFTDELQPTSDLAIQTKQYQADLDAEVETRERIRMDKIYHDQAPKQNAFTGADIARESLQTKCVEFFSSVARKEQAEKRRSSILRRSHRNSTEQKLLAREIRGSGEFTVAQVSDITKQLETQWKESNGKVATNFTNICQKLDNHKQLFQWFPSGNMYTSTLCGAVVMIVQASVNYSNIAEHLSGYVAELSDSISVCTQWLNLYSRPSMQTRLSDIYKQFFDFFINVATWYLKPKSSKLLDSFNSNFSTEYETAVEKIKNSIRLINEEAQIENAMEVKTIAPHIDQSLEGLEARITAQVIQSRKENNDVGRGMYNFLFEQSRWKCYVEQKLDTLQQRLQPPGTLVELVEDNTHVTATIEHPIGLSRAEAEHICERLQSFIKQAGGSDGIRLAIQAGRLLAEPTVVLTLGKWTQSISGNAQILWVISPFEMGPQTSAQLGALGMIWTAVEAKAQFISHICQRPHYGRIPGFKNAEDSAGILAMVYSLIRQLLQFQPPDNDDDVRIDAEMLHKLTDQSGPDGKWDIAMALLKMLLENTPSLRYCIISGLNLLEGGARAMCQEFVDVFLAHVQNAEWPVRVLFTTSGQSRALSSSVPRGSKVLTNNTFHQTKGRMLCRDIKMVG